MPLYRLPDPGTIRILNTTTGSTSSSTSFSDSASDIEESRRELEAIHVLLEERLPVQDDSELESE